jgi:hypothetical protein
VTGVTHPAQVVANVETERVGKGHVLTKAMTGDAAPPGEPINFLAPDVFMH